MVCTISQVPLLQKSAFVHKFTEFIFTFFFIFKDFLCVCSFFCACTIVCCCLLLWIVLKEYPCWVERFVSCSLWDAKLLLQIVSNIVFISRHWCIIFVLLLQLPCLKRLLNVFFLSWKKTVSRPTLFVKEPRFVAVQVLTMSFLPRGGGTAWFYKSLVFSFVKLFMVWA